MTASSSDRARMVALDLAADSLVLLDGAQLGVELVHRRVHLVHGNGSKVPGNKLLPHFVLDPHALALDLRVFTVPSHLVLAVAHDFVSNVTAE